MERSQGPYQLYEVCGILLSSLTRVVGIGRGGDFVTEIINGIHLSACPLARQALGIVVEGRAGLEQEVGLVDGRCARVLYVEIGEQGERPQGGCAHVSARGQRGIGGSAYVLHHYRESGSPGATENA